MSAQRRADPAALATVGLALPRIDAAERVTGRAKYTGDLRLPGTLYARAVRSPHPHDRVRSIDTSRAAALPGVRAIITYENAVVWWGAGSIAGGAQYNDEIKARTTQRRYVFNNPVRFAGDPVAAVAAVNRHAAEEAVRLLTVEYEPLPFVLDVERALEPDAPRVWPEGNLALDVQNRAQPMTSRSGDFAAGLAEADEVFEARLTTAFVHDAQMERHVALASWEGDTLTVYTPLAVIKS